jgi:hypothetical protein
MAHRPPPQAACSVIDGGEHGADPGTGRACAAVPLSVCVIEVDPSIRLLLTRRSHGSLRGRCETASSWVQGVATLQCSGDLVGDSRTGEQRAMRVAHSAAAFGRG